MEEELENRLGVLVKPGEIFFVNNNGFKLEYTDENGASDLKWISNDKLSFAGISINQYSPQFEYIKEYKLLKYDYAAKKWNIQQVLMN